MNLLKYKKYALQQNNQNMLIAERLLICSEACQTSGSALVPQCSAFQIGSLCSCFTTESCGARLNFTYLLSVIALESGFVLDSS